MGKLFLNIYFKIIEDHRNSKNHGVAMLVTEVWETAHCSVTAATSQDLEAIKPLEIMGCGQSSG